LFTFPSIFETCEILSFYSSIDENSSCEVYEVGGACGFHPQSSPRREKAPSKHQRLFSNLLETSSTLPLQISNVTYCKVLGKITSSLTNWMAHNILTCFISH
jgi:hypothetical protein